MRPQGEDESAVYVYGGGIYTLSASTLTKTGDTSSVYGDSSSVEISCANATDDSGDTIPSGIYSLTGGGSLIVD